MTLTLNSNDRLASAGAVLGALLLLAVAPVQGCVLIGLEPDEIDIAEGSEDGGATGGVESADDGTSLTSSGGDGDPGDTGDNDTMDPTSGEDTGTEGDTDTTALPCDELEPIPLMEGENGVVIPDRDSELEASCGAPGPEQVYSISVEVDTTVSFTLQGADFEGGVLYLVDTICEPLEELQCVAAPGPLTHDLVAGGSYYVVVDTELMGGNATLLVEGQ